MSKRLITRTGLEQAVRQSPAPKHRSIAFVELITTAALALSTAVAVTVVSIGIARAGVAGAVSDGDTTPFAVALCFALLVCALGVLTAVVAVGPRRE